MSVISVRGKQAESPVRGKFTLRWGAEVEEGQSWCSGCQSVVGGAHRSHVPLAEKKRKKKQKQKKKQLCLSQTLEDEGDEQNFCNCGSR